jgi:2,4-dienoyl-CoA reductase-like NADH-dependent reductase (Old Yellow Enzyme family)
MAEAGADYLHIASEGSGYFESADLGGVGIAALARKVSGKPVIANGGLQDPVLAKRVLEEGQGDLTSLGRGALANPDWPARLAG